MTNHQKQQVKIIEEIEKECGKKNLSFSTVTPLADFKSDPRICLTSVHFPKPKLIDFATKIINSLRTIEPHFFYYPKQSLHLTIKNIRTINNPPNFGKEDIKKAVRVFEEVVPKHHQFKIYFYRLLLFPYNLALVGTTDPELDAIHLELDQKLRQNGVADNKKYVNRKYFFANMTLARFPKTPSLQFRNQVSDLSARIDFPAYSVDSVSLITSNAALYKKRSWGIWHLDKVKK